MRRFVRRARWRQLEPTSRDADMADGLAAAVHDPLWMLSRQWHVGELRGEDAGSPVDIDISVEHDGLDRFERRGDGDGAVVAYDGGPLESAIERERVLTNDPPARLAVEAGRAFLELLEAEGFDDDGEPYVARDFDGDDPDVLLSEPDEALPETERTFFRVMAGRTVDGAAVFESLNAAREGESYDFETVPLPKGCEPETIDADDESAYEDAADEFCEWYLDLFDEPDDDGDAWRPTRLEYDGAVATGSGADENTFEMNGYPGGRLSWHAFTPSDDELEAIDDDDGATSDGDGDSAQPGDGASETPDEWLVPTPVTVPGMPTPRWWEVEDAGLLFGDVSVDGLNLVRLLVQEFAVTYGNDWFSLPLEDVPIGSLTRIPSMTVTDSFGIVEDVESAENDDWRLFSHDLPNDDHHQGLFLPPTVSDAIESDPVEQVVFGRDPMANLVFALERLVEGPTGEPIERAEFTQPGVEISRAVADADPTEEFVELHNPGDDVYAAETLHLASETNGERDRYVRLTDWSIEPGERVRLYTGSADARDGIGAELDESTLQDAHAVALVRAVTADDGNDDENEDSDDEGENVGDDEPDGETDNPEYLTVAKRPLRTVAESDADYRLANEIPDHWFPLTVEREAELFGEDVDPDDWDDLDEWEYRLLLSVVLDANSLDRPIDEIPMPRGRILDPDPETLPDGEDVLKLFEETITRSGRTADRRYQYVHWADGTVHCWSGRTVRPGYGELASALRFDVLDDSG
ncbi:lamin tail domain-containing protein [Halovivax gelatinilyticus]|uniref:lamin tail domain-containing protein n=1 Tax=Halovivax gelatinilyticus TaxID=2961597 RepID=UPI0020CA5353|nr:lamin tail domain-containing protein [Halovivax gelatinilyticus]